jgi:hypothetical protein
LSKSGRIIICRSLLKQTIRSLRGIDRIGSDFNPPMAD